MLGRTEVHLEFCRVVRMTLIFTAFPTGNWPLPCLQWKAETSLSKPELFKGSPALPTIKYNYTALFIK